LNYKTPSTPQLRLSREAKPKAPCAYSEATAALLASITLLGGVKSVTYEANTRAPVHANSVSDPASLSASSAKVLCHEGRGKARLSANSEALLTSLAGRTLHVRAKFASKSKTRTVASPCDATL